MKAGHVKAEAVKAEVVKAAPAAVIGGEAFRTERELLAAAPARVAELDARARACAAEAVKCALACGRLLLAVKGRMEHGAFLLWLSAECPSVKYRTAARYMEVAARYDGDAQAAAERTLTQLYRDYGIVKAPEGWGGRREGAGRRPADPGAEAAEAAAPEGLLWGCVRAALDELLRLDSERGVFDRLDDGHLADAVNALRGLCTGAEKALQRRLGNGGR